MPHLDVIRNTLGGHEPELGSSQEGDTFAAVALVLTGDAHDPDFLFIERAHRTGDPWSGHMAFPGGRVDGSDAEPEAEPEAEDAAAAGAE